MNLSELNLSWSPGGVLQAAIGFQRRPVVTLSRFGFVQFVQLLAGPRSPSKTLASGVERQDNKGYYDWNLPMKYCAFHGRPLHLAHIELLIRLWQYRSIPKTRGLCIVHLVFRHSPLPGANDEKRGIERTFTQGCASLSLGYHLSPLRGLKMVGKYFLQGTFDIRRSVFSVQCSAFDVQRSTFSVQCSAFDVQRSTFSVRRSAFDVPKRCSAVRDLSSVALTEEDPRSAFIGCFLSPAPLFNFPP